MYKNGDNSSATKIKNKKIPCISPRGERFKEELLSKIVPWEKITDSLEQFPYYLERHTKVLLKECVASHLKKNELRIKHVGRLESLSNKILLQSIAGTGRYLERLVRALAREMQVPFLKFDVDHDYLYRAYDRTGGGYEIGDRVVYDGEAISIDGVFNRTLSPCQQRGEVYQVDGDRVAVVFNICGLEAKEAERDMRNTEASRHALVTWLDVAHVRRDHGSRAHDCIIAIEALHEVLASQQPLIVYFPDPRFGLPLPQPSDSNADRAFCRMVDNIFNQSPEGVVMICGDNNCKKWDGDSEEMKKLPYSLKSYVERAEGRWRYRESKISKLFTNVVCINPPKDQDLANKFMIQIEEDRLTTISERNLSIMLKILKAYNLSCMNLEQSHFEDMILTAERVEKIVGWATNHYLSTCDFPRVDEGKLHIPRESIKVATLRLKEEEPESKKQSYITYKKVTREKTKARKKSDIVKELVSGYDERCLTRAIVCSEDIGLKFDDVALESVKMALHETVILPMRRPGLFSHGNLLRPCQGILLYGPPGTGKALIAKALAAESKANFINATSATNTPKSREDTKKLIRIIISLAIKLAPVIIFVDEDDNLLRTRGHNKHDTVRLNEFIAVWDALETPGILFVGATNCPYDLDEAVIRRMTRRIYVGLPDVENRRKILKALLKKQNLESEFSFEKLAEATEGYSGSDLKNLCCAAAYRPIQELVEQESKARQGERVAALRPLNLNDFIHSKATVRLLAAQDESSIMKMREWHEQYGEADMR